MIIGNYEFWFTPVGYNKLKEFHVIKKTNYGYTIKNTVFLDYPVETEFERLLKEGNNLKIEMFLFEMVYEGTGKTISKMPKYIKNIVTCGGGVE